MPDQQFAWIEAALAEAPREEFRDRLRADLERRIQQMTATIPAAFTAVTPFVSVFKDDLEQVAAFVKNAFGALEVSRESGSGEHPFYVMRIGDSMLMLSGGTPERGKERIGAFHVYVPDVDAVYRRALAAGGRSTFEPEDRPYGERNCGVKDPIGNLWFIATRLPGASAPEGMRTVSPYIHTRQPFGMIDFLKNAFGAQELGVYKSPEGRVMHAALRIGDAIIEMGETEPMPAAFYLSVPDVDTTHQRAIGAGATSLSAPADQPWGDRVGGVEDPSGNHWYIATPLRRQGR